nr:hypothetical protein [Micromonospora sp. DSM 115978]
MPTPVNHRNPANSDHAKPRGHPTDPPNVDDRQRPDGPDTQGEVSILLTRSGKGQDGVKDSRSHQPWMQTVSF